MKKRIVALVLAVLTLVLALGFAGCKKNDKTDWDYIADKGELVIGITYFRPMNYMENGELVGFETEFAKAVCEKLGVTAGLSKSYLPVKDQGTSLMEVKSKTADIAIIDAVTAAGSIGEGTDYDDLMIVDVISSADSEVYAVGIRKSDTELTAKINAAIKELYDDGTLAKLAEKYNLSGRVIAQ